MSLVMFCVASMGKQKGFLLWDDRV